MKTLGILLSGLAGFGIAYMIPTQEIAVAAGTLVIASGELSEKKSLKSAGIGMIIGAVAKHQIAQTVKCEDTSQHEAKKQEINETIQMEQNGEFYEIKEVKI
jgi:hypothetical protein